MLRFVRSDPSMISDGNRCSDLLGVLQINLGEANPLSIAALSNDGSPGVYDDTVSVTVSLTLVVVNAPLSWCEDPALGLDGACSQ